MRVVVDPPDHDDLLASGLDELPEPPLGRDGEGDGAAIGFDEDPPDHDDPPLGLEDEPPHDDPPLGRDEDPPDGRLLPPENEELPLPANAGSTSSRTIRPNVNNRFI